MVELLTVAIWQPPATAISGRRRHCSPISGLLSLGVMGVGLWLMLAGVLRTIRARIVGALVAGSVVALINVLFSALLMFASRHDVLLLSLLSFFAVVVSVSLGTVLASSLTDRLRAVSDAAATLATGDLTVRVPPPTPDAASEVRALTVAFNMMAEQLEEAATRRADDDEARRMLVAAISHDLRTPLASIRAMIEAITDGVVTDAETIARFHATMGREIRTLSALITDLFELSQLEAGQLALSLAPATLPDLIAEVVEGLSAQAAAREIHIASGVEGAVGPVVIDTPAVRRVLANLVQNALRHTPADGTVAVTARAVAEGVQVDVVDTGEGIPADRSAAYLRAILSGREIPLARDGRRGPRPGDRARLRRGAWRPHLGRERGGPGHALLLHPPAYPALDVRSSDQRDDVGSTSLTHRSLLQLASSCGCAFA